MACTLALAVTWAEPAAAGRQQDSSLRVTARDATGAVIVGATVELSRPSEDPAVEVTSGRGVAELNRLAPGEWTLRVSSPGFDDYIRHDLVLDAGENALDVTLRIAGLVEEITVGRDPQEAAVDPRGDSLTVTLTESELDTLPDTEEELQQLLEELAGPDAEISVDGFLGGSLPPKARIQEIRIQRAIYSADRHWGGRGRIQIITRPGTEGWRASVALGFRDDALDARNAFAREDTPEQMKRVQASVQGPVVKDRTSVSLDVEARTAYESNTVRAVLPDGRIDDLVRQPADAIDFTVGLQHALTPLTSLRLEYRHEHDERENLGVGDFDLPERAYDRTGRERRLRLSSIGTFGGRWLNETRLQVSWEREQAMPRNQAPAVDVLDAVRFGGASVSGGRRSREFVVEQKLEARLGAHNLATGGRFEWTRLESDEISNANGRFVFSTLEAFAAGLPSTYRVLRGDPSVRYHMFQGGLFLQNDIRIRKNLLLGVGVRQEWQSHVGDRWNPAPRVGVSWSPAADGRMVIRGGLGLFNEWYGASTYEETLQSDGVRTQDLTLVSPGYPDPFAEGALEILPNSRVLQAAGLELPLQRQGTVAVERRLGSGARIDVSYSLRDEIRQLRGRNINAPVPGGARPDPAFGNVIEIRSIGISREDEVTVGGSLRLPWRGLFVASRYTYENERDDGDGPLSLPASNEAPDEWGPSSDDVRHRVSVFTAFEPVGNVRVGVNFRAESAPPYAITTGRDDNGDTVFNDRPAGVHRNSARGEGQTRLDVRLAWRVGTGSPRAGGALPQRAGPGRGGRGQREADWRSRHLLLTELYVRASNVLNSVNPMRFSGVLTSPFFGQPTAARDARRFEVGARVMF